MGFPSLDRRKEWDVLLVCVCVLEWCYHCTTGWVLPIAYHCLCRGVG